FLAIFVAEVCLCFSSLPFLSKSSMIAIVFGAAFLTCFSYFILLFYYQAKKPEQFNELKEQFVQSCRQMISIPEGEVQHHLSIAEALSKLAAYLQNFESSFYKVPSIFSVFGKTISWFSTRCYGEDVYKMKLLLLHAAIDEHLKQISSTPTDLEVHASLANTYVTLSRVYKDGEDTEEKSRLASR